MSGIVDTIQGRRSVRTFENKSLTTEDRAYVEQIIQSVETPFGAPVEFRLLDAAEHGLKSPVIVGAQERGLEGRFVTRDPEVTAPKNTEYITSFEAAR